MAHIVVMAQEADQMPYRDRKVNTTQNVMATCSFDMKFTFVYTGWEGSAHDSRIFVEALTITTTDFPHQTPNKYYLVDIGYTNMPELIVMACCVLHKWIRMVQEQDEFFDAEESSEEDEDDDEDEDEDQGKGEGEGGGGGGGKGEGEGEGEGASISEV
ncbi:hypothetical protein ACSBR1_020634 [Camellia fascicularis]